MPIRIKIPFYHGPNPVIKPPSQSNKWVVRVWQKGGPYYWYCIYERIGPFITFRKNTQQW